MKARTVVLASGLAGIAWGIGVSWADFGRTPTFDPNRLPVRESVDGVPQLAVDTEFHNFGVIDRYNKVKHTFHITNVGTGTLTLRAGQTTCSACTIAALSSPEVPPGGSADIVVEYSPRKAKSEFQQLAIVLSNDPQRPRLELKILGSIRSKYRMLPEEIVMSNVSAHGTASGEVKILNFVADELRVVDYRLEDEELSEFFDVRIEDMSPEEVTAIESQAKSGCRVVASLKPGMPLGTFEQSVILEVDTGSGDKPTTVDVPIRGAVVGDLKIVGRGWRSDDSRLSLGSVNRRQGAKRQLNLLVRGDARHDVEIEPIQLDPSWLRVEVGKPEDLNQSVVRIPLTVEIPSDSPAAAYQGAETGKYAEVVLGVKNHPDTKQLRMRLTFVTGDE